MVPVGDQQLRVRDLLRERVAELRIETPEARRHAAFLGGEVGLAEPVERDRPVEEQEDRLELRARRPEQAQATLLRPGVRPLVRQDHALLVGLDSQCGDEPLARALDAVRPDVVLPQPPVRGLVLLDEHARAAPVGEVARRLALRVRQGQMDDVVGAAREILRSLRLGDDVVRRCHDIGERGHVVAKRLEGSDGGHRLDDASQPGTVRYVRG